MNHLFQRGLAALTLLALLLSGSCTVQQRLYQPGWNVEWKHRLQEAEPETAPRTVTAVQEQPAAASVSTQVDAPDNPQMPVSGKEAQSVNAISVHIPATQRATTIAEKPLLPAIAPPLPAIRQSPLSAHHQQSTFRQRSASSHAHRTSATDVFGVLMLASLFVGLIALTPGLPQIISIVALVAALVFGFCLLVAWKNKKTAPLTEAPDPVNNTKATSRFEQFLTWLLHALDVLAWLQYWPSDPPRRKEDCDTKN